MRNARWLAAGVAGLLTACTTYPVPEWPTPREAGYDIAARWVRLLSHQDVPALMDLYSDEYLDAAGRDKAALERYAEDLKAGGALDGLTVSTAPTELFAEGKDVRISYIEVTGAWGQAAVELTALREGVDWRIVTMDVTRFY